ncbi:MAG: aldehyde ferredoxin oxidoreductase, partial [Rhodobacteraceae bacterium]|nr:aldehyde ferredoxin oxidoreductase [Paracoccaceae bacterium]
MRKTITIDLGSQSISGDEIEGAETAISGRYLIAKTLLEGGVAKVDPLGPDNPLIFSAGPFAGTNFSNANRISVGCKSPLTGGIKEANSGGIFATAMGQLQIAQITLTGNSPDWVVIRITKDGAISFDDATPYLGLGNFDCAELLLKDYGKKCALALIGPVGEYCGLMSGISFTDTENRPARLAARGGVGALMGTKKVKAIVIDKDRMPPLHDLKKFMECVTQYSKYLGESAGVEAFSTTGTAMVGDLTNQLGGLPVRNFTSGRASGPDEGPFKLGGNYIRELNASRGGEISHACMRGCKIKCSNVFVDEDGKELVSPLEYENIGLMGTNCGLTHPDQVARVNQIANDLGVDTIELGVTIGILMDAGKGEFGDTDFMVRVMEDLHAGNDNGRLYAQGAARVGAHLGMKRVPVIKKQAISAYDPRVIEGTGVSMMLTAQGADHTVGNLPSLKTSDL